MAGDYLFSPKVYNELSPGNSGTGSYSGSGAIEFPLFGTSFELEGDYRHVTYPHTAGRTAVLCTSPGVPAGCNANNNINGYLGGGTLTCPIAGDPGCVTVVAPATILAAAGGNQAYVNAFSATENAWSVGLGVKIFDPRVYLGAGYMGKTYNYLSYPNVNGIGFGITKLPDLDRPLSIYGNAWYYPSVTGNYTYPTSTALGTASGQTYQLGYTVLRYKAGATLNIGPSSAPFGIFIDAGYAGERFNSKTNSPSSTTMNAPYVGLGIKF